MDDQIPTDLQQARLLLSLKNDELKSLNNKMKMIQKKSNIKVSEVNYQLQQEKGKVTNLQKKLDKLKGQLQSEKQKNKELQAKIKLQIDKKKQLLDEMVKKQKNLQRTLKNQIYQLELTIQQIKVENQNMKKQLKQINKIIPINHVLGQGNHESFDQLVPYLRLKQLVKQQQQQLCQMERKMEQQKIQMLITLEESFSQVNSYQQVMSQLHKKNQQLQLLAKEHQKLYQVKHMELQSTTQVLQTVTEMSNQKMEELTSQVIMLRNSVSQYEKEYRNYQQDQVQHENNMKFILQLTTQFQEKQEQYLKIIQDLGNQIQKITMQRQNQKKQLLAEVQQLKQENTNLSERIHNQVRNVQDKQNIINMINSSLKALEIQFESQKLQIQKNKEQISELIRKKQKLQQQLNDNQSYFQSKQQSLLQQLQLLRNMNNIKYAQQDSNFRSSSLAQQINTVQVNWFELYGNVLRKHNDFVKEVYFLLTKQPRLNRQSNNDSNHIKSRNNSLLTN